MKHLLTFLLLLGLAAPVALACSVYAYQFFNPSAELKIAVDPERGIICYRDVYGRHFDCVQWRHPPHPPEKL